MFCFLRSLITIAVVSPASSAHEYTGRPHSKLILSISEKNVARIFKFGQCKGEVISFQLEDQNAHSYNGLILAGGKSSRMGSDKAWLNYYGKPQVEHLLDLLSGVCAKVFVAASADNERYNAFNVVQDRYTINGPLNGIISAFDTDASLPWIVIAVDMPFITGHAIQELIGNRDASKVATCFRSDNENPYRMIDPLFALWEPKAFLLLQNYVKNGGDSVQKFLEVNEVHAVNVPDPSWLINVNNADQYPLIANQIRSKLLADSCSHVANSQA